MAYRKLSLETIDHQTREFGDHITGLVGEIVTAIKANSDITKIVREIEQYIFHERKIKLKLFTNSVPASVIPMFANKHAIFLEKAIRGEFTISDQEKILNLLETKEGSVNTKNATLGGIFSIYEHKMAINFKALTETYLLTPPEITGVILH